MDVFDLKRRSVHFFVKSTLGRFLKHIDRNQIEGVTVGTSGLRFELVNLELNEEMFNSEVLVEAPVRLVSGSINAIKGTLGLSMSEARDLTVEGIDLTFDVIANHKAREATSEDTHATHHPHTGATSTSAGSFYSLASGPISRDELRSEILGGLGDEDNDDEQVNEGVSALSSVIKNLVNSITFTAEHVNVRLRFPPPGGEILFGKPPPEGSVELLLSLPHKISVVNVPNQSGASNHGNSFQKEVRFSGLRVALYDLASKAQHEVMGGEEVQRVKHSDIIFGGPVETIGNVLSLRFIDAIQDRDARWEVGMFLSELRSIISPTQLSRLGVVMDALLGAPDAGDDAGTSQKSLATDASKFTLSCTAMSLALLQDDNDEEVGACWKADDGKSDSLSTPHYAVSVTGGAFQVLDSTLKTKPEDDPYHYVFDRFSGRCYSIGIGNFSVVEKRPGPQYAPQTLLTFRHHESASRHAKSLLCVVRTTCPMSVANARDAGVKIPDGDGFGMPISRMDIAIHFLTDLELAVDVDILDRIVRFAAHVGQLFNAKQQLGTTQHQSSWGNTAETSPEGDTRDPGHSPFDDFETSQRGGFLRVPSAGRIFDADDSVESSVRGIRTALPLGGLGDEGMEFAPHLYDDLERKEYLTMSSISFKAKQLTFHVKFPSGKRPDPDLYGPLTQQLFSSLVTAASSSPSADDTATQMGSADGSSIFGEGLGGPSTVSSASRGTMRWRSAKGPLHALPDAFHLKKALLIEVRDLLVDLPGGSSNIVHVDGTSASVFLLDMPTGKRGDPILDIQLRPPRASQGAAATKFCRVLLRPESSPFSATTLLLHPELGKGVTMVPSEVKFSTVESSDVALQKKLAAGSDIDVSIHIERVSGTLHQDDLLLIMFMVDEALECVSKASRRLERVISQQTALAVADAETLGDSRRAIPASSVALNLSVRDAKVTLWAPRLCSNGKPAGQPLFMTLPIRYMNRDTEHSLYHRLNINANSLDVFLYNYTHPWTTGKTGAAENKPKTDGLINVRALFVKLEERLPLRAPSTFIPPDTTSASTPKWGTTVPLLTSYASVYNRLSGGDHIPQKHPLQVFVRRSVDLQSLRVDTSVNVQLDRTSVPHQVAHVGDHWLLTLIALVGDSPIASAGTEGASASRANPEESDGGDSDDSTVSNTEYTQPMTTVTRVTVTATNTLVDYQPFGYGCRIAALIPVIKVKTSDLASHRPDARIKVYLRVGAQTHCELANILFHPNFGDQLVNTEDPSQGSLGSNTSSANIRSSSSSRSVTTGRVARNSVIIKDLERLGFVQMLSVSTPTSGATVVVDLGGPEQPTKVQVRRLEGQFTCAKDSFQYFQIALSHYLGGLDAQFLPTPQMLVQTVAHGRHVLTENLPVVPPVFKQFRVTMHIVEEEFEDRIRQCLNTVFIPNLRDDMTIQADRGIAFVEPPVVVAHVPSSSHLDADGFDLIDAGEAGLTQPKWVWSKTINNLATYPGDNSALVNNMDLRLMDGGLPPADPDEVQRNWPSATFSLSDFSTPGHFACKADKLDAAFTRGFSLVGCPPVEVEIMLLGCHGTVRLFDGLDFVDGRGGVDVSQPHMDDFDHSRVPTQEAICATIQGINAQIDVFRDGFDMGMRAYVEVKDIEIEDRIEKSEVRTLFMASVPKEFRDPSSSMLELQWTTILPRGLPGMAGPVSCEEQLSLRLEPFVLTLHRRAIDMLVNFFTEEQGQWDRLNIEVPPSTMYFNRVFIHPIVATVNVLFEVKSFSKAMHGEVSELCHLLPSLEGSKVQLHEIDIRSCHVNNLGDRIVDLLSKRMLTMNAIFLLLCGIQPVRAATEMGKASVGLLIQPLEHYKRNQSVYAGILRGIQAFSRVSAAELLKMGAGATRAVHHATNMSTGRYSRALVRGSQPRGFGDGVKRAAMEMQMGVAGAVEMVLADGVLATWRIPPIITDGFLKAFTEVLQGMRNGVNPADMNLERKLYKSRTRHFEN